MQFFNQYRTSPGFIVPSGNLGNVTAAYWAKTMGFPIREIVIATNTNRVIVDYLESGKYQPVTTHKTLANAMDVGNSSNFERLNYLFNTFKSFKENVRAFSVTDSEIQTSICDFYQQHHKIICPHTATAAFTRKKLSDNPWIIVATAAPSKFETIIEPLLQQKIEPAPQLKAMLAKQTHQLTVPANKNDLQKVIQCYFKI